MAWTKEHRAEYMKKYRAENKEQIRANKRYWLDRHREENRQYQRELYQKRKQRACTASADCSKCEYAYHDIGFNECAVDGVKPLERSEA